MEQIRRHLDVDSLGYLSIEGVRSIAGNSRLGICDACFSGNYPIPVSEEHREDKIQQKSWKNKFDRITEGLSYEELQRQL